MTGSSPILNLFCLLSILISSGHGVNIQAYRHKNFTGLVWGSHSTDVCNNIPEDKRADIYSIRTDTCLIVYTSLDCKSWWSQKHFPGDIVLFYGVDLKWIHSFHLCNEEEGGSQLNLDITKYYSREASVPPDVLESYKKVCSCINVPHHVQNMNRWSIDNHHNALLAYYEPDCAETKWNSIFIRARPSWYSRDMHLHKRTDSVTNTTYKIQSFGPDPNSTYFQTSCKLEALPYKFIELQKQFEQSKQSQDNLERAIESILKQHKDDINSLTQNITQLHQESRNFTAKIRSDLTKLFL